MSSEKATKLEVMGHEEFKKTLDRLNESYENCHAEMTSYKMAAEFESGLYHDVIRENSSLKTENEKLETIRQSLQREVRRQVDVKRKLAEMVHRSGEKTRKLYRVYSRLRSLILDFHGRSDIIADSILDEIDKDADEAMDYPLFIVPEQSDDSDSDEE